MAYTISLNNYGSWLILKQMWLAVDAMRNGHITPLTS